MGNLYKISIIVTVYNTGKYLPRCVGSLMQQTGADLEILLIDDGSTDESGKICEELAKKDSRIQVVHKGNGGLISAWKCGVQKSGGDYLCFVDSDDWIEHTMIQEMARLLTGNPKEIIASDYVIERENGIQEPVYQQLPPGEYGRGELEKEVISQLLGQEERYVTISRCMKLIARGLIEENQHYSDERIRMGEDTTIMLPALIDCDRLVIMDHKTYYHYLQVTDSMTHKYDEKLYGNICLLREITLRIIQDKFQGKQQELMRGQADKEHIFMLLLALKNEARGNPKGYYQNIRQLCRQDEVYRLVSATKVTVRQMSNRLLYLVLRHPNQVTVRLLRLAMILYYR